MARFDKLEFGPEPRPATQPDDEHSELKDESHWLNLADQQRRRGNYENALRYYSRALELDKSLVVGWVGQVQMLVQMDECSQAEVWSRKALELFPANAELLAAQAQALCRMGDRKNAHAASDAALQQKGASAYRWLVRGEIMIAGKQATDLHCFDKAQQADDDWLVPLEAALIYLYYRIPSKAQLRAQRAVERAPDAHYAWYVLGLCQSQLGFRTGARASMHRCLELCPRHIDAQRKLTELEERQWPLFETLRRLIGRP